MMELLKEMKQLGFPIRNTTLLVHCKVFEDNSGALKIPTTKKYRPRTKHLNVKLHHFRDYLDCKEISIHPVGTDDQLADFLTKPVNLNILNKLRSPSSWGGELLHALVRRVANFAMPNFANIS
jgi:hypothetical protein